MVAIAVVGATGMLGRPVTDAFIQAGFRVRVLARNVAQARALFPRADVVPGDLSQPDQLRTALTGVDAVYLNLSVKPNERPTDFHTETEGLRHLLTVATTLGIGRIGYLSSLVMRYQGMNGFDWWVFRVKHEAVRLIKTSGIPYSIFYPSCFMESLNRTQRLGRYVLLVDQSPVRPWYVSAQDYGRQVVRAFRQAQPGWLQEYVIQGPEPLMQHEAARRFVRAYPHETLSLLTAPGWLMRLGRPLSAQAGYGWHITEALNRYPEAFEAGQTWAELGKPTITIEQFAQTIARPADTP